MRVRPKEHASMSSSSQLVPSTPDVLVRNEGTVFLFCPLTSRGKQWIEEHVQPPRDINGGVYRVVHWFVCWPELCLQDVDWLLSRLLSDVAGAPPRVE